MQNHTDHPPSPADPAQGVPLPKAAHRLGLSYHQLWPLVLKGVIKGQQDARGRWTVDAADLERYAAAQGNP